MSEWPYALLDIDEDADERTIKRAYARLLKTTRPDEDPAGFQRLHEAYQEALALQREQVLEVAAEDAHITLPSLEVTASDATSHVPLHRGHPGARPDEPAPPRLDEAALREELIAHAGGDLPSAFRHYLEHHPALYGLDVKHRIGQAIFESIAYEEIQVRPGTMAVLADFFGFTPPEWVERRQHVLQAVSTENTDAFDEDRPLTIRQLKRAFGWPLALALACVPGFAFRAARLSRRLTAEYGGDVPGLDGRQQAFFERLADPFHAGPWRWATVVLTAAFATLAIAGLCAVSDLAPERQQRMMGLTFVAVAGMLCIWHAMRALWALRERPATMHSPAIALMPVWLAVAGLLVAWWVTQLPPLAFLLVLPAALLYFRQFFDALRFAIGTSWLVRALPMADDLPSPWLLALAGSAIGMTICDWAYARRHRISIAAAVGNRWTTIASFAVFVGLGIAGLAIRYG
ncbi:hypothetical protein [Pseudoxanthomonas sp. SE1]|uniref:hypothetical protein n=1 Tax=Pseudoxanthomonas sp. SE1 TaxID=1664560 RepID=UPI00240CE52D|nr:hypothetical protein [Pseudoxanthomonas sp. SE1]WFC43491.1 hypothetical protein OY559_08340 [Pseudoxanthomonas sp. SE1]